MRHTPLAGTLHDSANDTVCVFKRQAVDSNLSVINLVLLLINANACMVVWAELKPATLRDANSVIINVISPHSASILYKF